MEVDIKVWLSDIQQAINEIYQFLPEQKLFTEFRKDLKSKRAIERNIEIIGEAMNRILNVNPNIEIQVLEKLLIQEIEFLMVMTVFLMILFGLL